MFYPHPFGYPFPPCSKSSNGHLPMSIYQQQNEVQTIIIKDNKQEISADAKDGNGLYRNCLVCGDNNKKCGSFIIAKIKSLANFQANTLELDFKSVMVAK
jgi:hypothetical protein